MLTIATFPQSVAIFRTHGTAGHTASFSQTSDISRGHDLGMFDPWSNCGDIRVFERDFQSVKHGSVRFVTDGMNALDARRAPVRNGEGECVVVVYIPLATHPPSTWVSFRSGSLA